MRGVPRVTLRRLWNRNAYGLWIGSEVNGAYHWAKPMQVVIEQDPDREGCQLPDPTIEIPQPIAKMIFEQFVQALELEGESATNTKQVIDAKNENLKDLRSIVDRLLPRGAS